MDEFTLPLPGLSPVSGKEVHACFDGGELSSDAGVLLLKEVEARLGIAEQLAGCIPDPRLPGQVTHNFADMIRFRLFMIAAGYEDGNDADQLRHDPVFRMASGRGLSEQKPCSQPTLSRLENRPGVRDLLRMGQALIDQYCGSFRQIPARIVLDIDETFDRVHGGQQLRLFNAYYDDYGFQPMIVLDGDGRPVTALLRPAKRPSGREIRAFLRRLLRALRRHWPHTRILLRGDSHYATPEVLDWCRAEGVDYILGVGTTSTLRAHVRSLEASTLARYQAAPAEGKQRRCKEFYDAAASWSRCERIIARVEAGAMGCDTRFVVTNLAGNGRTLYEKLYCRRGQAENHIKAWKSHLAADRTSCHRATANQFRLFLHLAAYWLLWRLRALIPARSRWRKAEFRTLRLHLIRVAARVVELKTRIRVHLPGAAPCQDLMRLLLLRIPRLQI